MREKILSEFQEFLISRNMIPEKYVSYFAHWVSRFLAFSNNNEDMMLEQRILHFLAKLRKDNAIADWQVQQAETAINLNNYLDGDASIFSTGEKKESYTGKEKEKDNFNLQHEYKDAVRKM